MLDCWKRRGKDRAEPMVEWKESFDRNGTGRGRQGSSGHYGSGACGVSIDSWEGGERLKYVVRWWDDCGHIGLKTTRMVKK
jgi:hypothetical protein